LRRGDDPVEKFGGGENPGNSGAGVGAGPAKIEAVDVFGDIVGTEPGALGEDWFELEGRAVVGIEAGFEIPRGEDEFADEVFAQVRDDGFFEGSENAVGVVLFLLLPIDLIPGGAEVGDGREDIEAFVALGGEGRIGAGGGVKVKGEVLCQNSVVEDIVEQSLITRAEPDGVVGEFWIGSVSPKIDKEKGHAIAHFFETAVGPLLANGPRDFFAVEIGHVGVGDNHLGAEGFPGAKADAGCGVVFHEELVNGGVQAKLPAEILEEFDEGLHEGTRSPHGKVHAPLPLEIVDHGVDGGGLERIPADEERMKGEYLA